MAWCRLRTPSRPRRRSEKRQFGQRRMAERIMCSREDDAVVSQTSGNLHTSPTTRPYLSSRWFPSDQADWLIMLGRANALSVAAAHRSDAAAFFCVVRRGELNRQIALPSVAGYLLLTCCIDGRRSALHLLRRRSSTLVSQHCCVSKPETLEVKEGDTLPQGCRRHVSSHSVRPPQTICAPWSVATGSDCRCVGGADIAASSAAACASSASNARPSAPRV